jgi:hypothetical protein
MSSRLDMAVEVSEPIVCCVTPIAQRMQTPFGIGDHMRDLISESRWKSRKSFERLRA